MPRGGQVRAAVIEWPGEISIQQVDDPSPGPREVLVQVEACGICGTDIHSEPHLRFDVRSSGGTGCVRREHLRIFAQ
jgi:hypothetical protein